MISTLTNRDDKCRILHCEPLLVSNICFIYYKRLCCFSFPLIKLIITEWDPNEAQLRLIISGF